MRVARILRTLRMARLAKIKDLIYSLQYRIDSEWMSIAWGLFSNVFILITLNHITACGWYFVGKTYWGTDANWIKYFGYTKAMEITKYLCALHWSLTLFTPASMNVHPQNDAERTYAVFCLIMAMVIFASFVSSVTAGFTRLRNLEAHTAQQKFLLRKFLRESTISVELSSRILRYIEISQLNHKKKVSHDSVGLLRWLSGPLNVELRRELCSPHMIGHPLLLRYIHTSHVAVNEVCLSACSFLSCAKCDTLFGRFAVAKKMYFVMSGSMAYRRATALPCPKYTRVGKKSYFGEPGIWVNWVHHGSMKALTETECMAIDCVRFREVTGAHRDVLMLACEYASSFHDTLTECFEDHGSAWDLPLDMIVSRTSPAAANAKADVALDVFVAEYFDSQILEWSDSEESGGEADAEPKGSVNRPSMKTVHSSLDKEVPLRKSSKPTTRQSDNA
jgi:hypothetical protein